MAARAPLPPAHPPGSDMGCVASPLPPGGDTGKATVPPSPDTTPPGTKTSRPLPDTPPPGSEDGDDDIISMFFTSGSTGRPKGCAVSRRAMAAYCHGKNVVHRVAGDSIVFVASAPTFDPSIGDFFATWMAGAVCALSTQVATLVSLGPLLAASRASHVLATPPLFETLQAAGYGPGRLPGLSVVALGGEPMPDRVMREWGGCVRLLNVYGTTECAVYQGYSVLGPGGPVEDVVGDTVGDTVVWGSRDTVAGKGAVVWWGSPDAVKDAVAAEDAAAVKETEAAGEGAVAAQEDMTGVEDAAAVCLGVSTSVVDGQGVAQQSAGDHVHGESLREHRAAAIRNSQGKGKTLVRPDVNAHESIAHERNAHHVKAHKSDAHIIKAHKARPGETDPHRSQGEPTSTDTNPFRPARPRHATKCLSYAWPFGTGLILAAGTGDDPLIQVPPGSGQEGEIWITGPQVGLGYARDLYAREDACIVVAVPASDRESEECLAKGQKPGCARMPGVFDGHYSNAMDHSNSAVGTGLIDRSNNAMGTGARCHLQHHAWEMVGRRDAQVKWMGRRLELGELEETLLASAAPYRLIKGLVATVTAAGRAGPNDTSDHDDGSATRGLNLNPRGANTGQGRAAGQARDPGCVELLGNGHVAEGEREGERERERGKKREPERERKGEGAREGKGEGAREEESSVRKLLVAWYVPAGPVRWGARTAEMAQGGAQGDVGESARGPVDLAAIGARCLMITSAALSLLASAHLPLHMRPSRFLPLPSFPMTATGKLDRRALSLANVAQSPHHYSNPFRTPCSAFPSTAAAAAMPNGHSHSGMPNGSASHGALDVTPPASTAPSSLNFQENADGGHMPWEDLERGPRDPFDSREASNPLLAQDGDADSFMRTYDDLGYGSDVLGSDPYGHGHRDAGAFSGQRGNRAGARAMVGWEATVAAAWEKQLGIGGLGPRSNFLELGGDSLAAMRACRELAKQARAMGFAVGDDNTAGIKDPPGPPRDDPPLVSAKPSAVAAKPSATLSHGNPSKGPQKAREEELDDGDFGELLGLLAPIELLHRPQVCSFARYLGKVLGPHPSDVTAAAGPAAALQQSEAEGAQQGQPEEGDGDQLSGDRDQMYALIELAKEAVAAGCTPVAHFALDQLGLVDSAPPGSGSVGAAGITRGTSGRGGTRGSSAREGAKKDKGGGGKNAGVVPSSTSTFLSASIEDGSSAIPPTLLPTLLIIACANARAHTACFLLGLQDGRSASKEGTHAMARAPVGPHKTTPLHVAVKATGQAQAAGGGGAGRGGGQGSGVARGIGDGGSGGVGSSGSGGGGGSGKGGGGRGGGGGVGTGQGPAGGSLEVVQILLSHGGDPAVTDAERQTVLHHAARAGAGVRVLEALLAAADGEYPVGDYAAPWDMGLDSNNMNGHDTNSRASGSGARAPRGAQGPGGRKLSSAKGGGGKRSGAKTGVGVVGGSARLLEARDAWGRTALHWGVVNGHAATVGALLRAGASAKVVDDAGETPVAIAERRALCSAAGDRPNGVAASMFGSIAKMLGGSGTTAHLKAAGHISK
eukprot:jgi/Mesvir1/4938/Mv04563-RA.1